MAASRFPTEVWDAIIDRIPEAGDTVALPASHVTTKSLHAMLLTCKATAKSSTRLLYRHCLYIDSRWRLQALVSSYGNSPALRETKVASSTALYLAPRGYWPRSTRDFAILVYSLFEILGEHLRRLVINFPRPSMDSGVGLQQRGVLRQAFQRLGVLEEYASVYDFLDFEDSHLHETPEQAIWPTWIHLRRLCLYNLTLSGQVIEFLSGLPQLRELVLMLRNEVGDVFATRGLRVTMFDNHCDHDEYEGCLNDVWDLEESEAWRNSMPTQDLPMVSELTMICIGSDQSDGSEEDDSDAKWQCENSKHWQADRRYIERHHFDRWMTELAVSGELWSLFDKGSTFLPYDQVYKKQTNGRKRKYCDTRDTSAQHLTILTPL